MNFTNNIIMKKDVKKDIGRNPKNITYKKMLDTLIEYFNGDKDKAISYYMKKNINMGNMSPYEMVKNGQGEKLMKLLVSQMIIDY